MRLGLLYLRSRLAFLAAACLVGVGALAWGWAPLMKYEGEALLLALLVMPLAAATVIGVSARSPFGEAERSAARSLPALRLGHFALLLALGCAALALASAGWPTADPAWWMARNALGLSGLALLAARVVGAGTSWVLPLAYAALALLAGMGPNGMVRPWAWPVQAGGHRQGAVFGLALLALGLAAVVLGGARESPGEAE